MGRQLAREYPVKADLVIPIPDSGVCAALGYADESGSHTKWHLSAITMSDGAFSNLSRPPENLCEDEDKPD